MIVKHKNSATHQVINIICHMNNRPTYEEWVLPPLVNRYTAFHCCSLTNYISASLSHCTCFRCILIFCSNLRGARAGDESDRKEKYNMDFDTQTVSSVKMVAHSLSRSPERRKHVSQLDRSNCGGLISAWAPLSNGSSQRCKSICLAFSSREKQSWRKLGERAGDFILKRRLGCQKEKKKERETLMDKTC